VPQGKQRDLKYLIGIEQESHGAIVYELKFHVRAEDARLDAHAERAQAPHKFLVERVGLLILPQLNDFHCREEQDRRHAERNPHAGPWKGVRKERGG
jgi:hypothetical protein